VADLRRYRYRLHRKILTPITWESIPIKRKEPRDRLFGNDEADKPVYTKAMCEMGELPTVGAILDIEFTFHRTVEKVEITYISNEVGCYRVSNGNEFTFALSGVLFHAIDTRTEEEKLAD